MKKLDNIFPGYGWFQNMGYGTKFHLQALGKLGTTREHRMTFRPMKNMI